MSMATFINAMTGEDSTYYPVASNVPKDLFNPGRSVLRRHLPPAADRADLPSRGPSPGAAPGCPTAPATGAPRLAISGIVYNEMKGAFSDPEARLGRLLNHSLLPDTIYSHESGGTPEAIPDLTYEFFRRYHATYYRPEQRPTSSPTRHRHRRLLPLS